MSQCDLEGGSLSVTPEASPQMRGEAQTISKNVLPVYDIVAFSFFLFLNVQPRKRKKKKMLV